MSAPSYKLTGIVLRKTKLGETDLIITFVTDTGEKAQAVAKGARKPRSSFASRLELFSEVEALIARGKSLDIVQEVRLIDAHANLRQDLDASASASCMCELVEKTSQPNLENPRVHQLLSAALHSVEACTKRQPLPGPSEGIAPCYRAITAAFLLKCFAFNGLRPSLVRCAACDAQVCGSPSQTVSIGVSVQDGGVLCNDCRSFSVSLHYSPASLQWMNALLMSTFANIQDFQIPRDCASDALEFCQQWCKYHIGTALKSLVFLQTI